MTDLIVKEEDAILWVSLNRRAKANSISRSITDTYIEATQHLVADERLKGMVWMSEAHDLFSGGVDLAVPEGFDAQQVSAWRTALIVDMIEATLACPKPLVVMTRGRMLGGAFLNALMCDRIMASPEATFCLPEVKIGMGSPIAAAVVETATNAGVAYDLLLSGREINATELKSLGGPWSIAPTDALRAETVQAVEQFASVPKLAFGYMKHWFQRTRLEALRAAREYTAQTRTGIKDEVTEAVRNTLSAR